MAVQRETSRDRSRSNVAKVAALREFTPDAFSRFTSNINSELLRLSETLAKLPDFTGFDPSQVVRKKDFEELYNDLLEQDFLSSEGEDVGSPATRARRNLRTSRQRKQAEDLVAGSLLAAVATNAPPKVMDTGAVGTTGGVPIFALEDHTHEGVNLDDPQTIVALKSFTGGIDGGLTGDDLIINSNAAVDGRIVLGDDITGTDSVVIHGTESGITINGVLFESRLAIHDEDAVAQASLLEHKHTNTAATAPTTIMARSRGTEAAETIVADNDILGRIIALGFDGTDYERAAQIHFEVDDTTPGAASMGGAVVLSTTVDGTVALVERTRIAQDGRHTFDGRQTWFPSYLGHSTAFLVDVMTTFAPTLSLAGALAGFQMWNGSPLVTINTASPLITMLNMGPTITNTVAPGGLYSMNGYVFNAIFQSNTNAVGPFLPDSFFDFCTVRQIGGTTATIGFTTVSLLSTVTHQATGGSSLTMTGGYTGYWHRPTIHVDATNTLDMLLIRGGFADDFTAVGVGGSNFNGTFVLDEKVGWDVADFTRGTLRTAFRSAMTSGTGKWNLYLGTADSSLAGRMFLGGTLGTVPNTDLDVDGDLAVRSANVALANGANSNIAIGARSFIHITGPTAAFTTTGFASGFDGKVLVVKSTVNQQWTIVNDATSTAANRIYTVDGADVILAAGAAASEEAVAMFIYSASLSRWILIAARDTAGPR